MEMLSDYSVALAVAVIIVALALGIASYLLRKTVADLEAQHGIVIPYDHAFRACLLIPNRRLADDRALIRQHHPGRYTAHIVLTTVAALVFIGILVSLFSF